MKEILLAVQVIAVSQLLQAILFLQLRREHVVNRNKLWLALLEIRADLLIGV